MNNTENTEKYLNKNYSFDLYSTVKDILRNWFTIILVGIIVALVCFVYAVETYEPQYYTSITLLVQSKTDDGKLNIVTTIFPYYDFAKNIVGDKVNVNLLLSPGSEPHHFEPSPSQMVDIENCDLFIYTGGESDEWAESIIDGLDNEVKVQTHSRKKKNGKSNTGEERNVEKRD